MIAHTIEILKSEFRKFSVINLIQSMAYPAGSKFSSDFKFCYFANHKFAYFKFCFLLHFYKSMNESLYNRNTKIKIR